MIWFSAALAAIPFQWGEHAHRWVMESDVQMPAHMWLYADRNQDVRVRSLRTQMVLGCTVSRGLFTCVVEDASFAGQTYPSERGTLKPVLDELDAKLTGAAVYFQLRPDGRMSSIKVNLKQLDRSTGRRTRYTTEMMRVVVQRMLAPLDLQVPRSGLEEGGWPQYQANALRLMSLRGTVGGGRLVHHAQRWGDNKALIATAGKATVQNGGDPDMRPIMFATQLSGHTILDTQTGTLDEARWEIFGEPTASAGLGVGFHASRIQIRSLTPREAIELEPTQEWMEPT